ncbi:MAG: TFIIB-type zinc ribbon-containing protein [Lachnospiraceae bacterium]|nr:TFIIB-type zinc ribbon-containing protein [Lachnospiraceae bacterium]
MYICPNCGGRLKFDIATQDMVCESCNSRFDPYGVHEEAEAEVGEYMDMVVYSCPQCGGEIYANEQTAASFCSYCGASTVLSERIDKKLRPKGIIPFQIGKQQCKEIYKKRIKKAIFAPNSLKKEGFLEEFRGIYMPYYVYTLSYETDITVETKVDNSNSRYYIYDYYLTQGHVSGWFDGFSADASSTFPDSISETIAPYMVENIREFTPAFLTGFYADNTDLSPEDYEEKMYKDCGESSYNLLSTELSSTSHNINESFDSVSAKFKPEIDDVKLTMFPVWFLTYRSKGRVSYATVNAESGRVQADIPISGVKYLLFSILLALPIFVLLNLFLVMKPSPLLFIVCLISGILLFIYNSDLNSVSIKENKEDDLGYMISKYKDSTDEYVANNPTEFAKLMQNRAYTANKFTTDEARKQAKKVIKKSKDSGNSQVAMYLFSMLIVYFVIRFFTDLNGMYGIMPIVAGIFEFIAIIKTSKKVKEGRRLGYIFVSLALIASGIIMILNPVYDYIYYTAAVFLVITTFIMITDIFYNFNLLSSRPIVMHTYKGGDHRG